MSAEIDSLVETVREGVPDFDQEPPYLPVIDATRQAQVALTRLAHICEQQREALAKIQQQQPQTLRMIEHNGFVFDSIGREPGNWQHLAFSIYTDLCEVESWASAALALTEEQA